MNIQSTEGVGVDALKVVIFGESGAGKTSLAGTLPDPERVFVVSAEAGLLPLRKKKIHYVDLSVDENAKTIPQERRIDRLLDVYRFLTMPETRERYDTIFIDSLTEINQNMYAQLCQQFPDRKDSLVLYGELAKRMRSLVKTFRDMPAYNVIFTALASQDKDENGVFTTQTQLIGKFAQQLPAFFDEVFYLDVDPATKLRRLVTSKTNKLMVKDRSGALDPAEPADLSVIFSKIRKEIPHC